ncbi:glycerol-3-phosphate dehydrogenase [Komagataeibacter nataicola]|uniref:Glycerol-3-phosphate dehydrogenase n=1 Tax=Komagataeibacter nataicola TaxID=265960 RepID=A0A9N7H238_9PROT|nr:glycerol-3-phosphate dehydrogenase/oxidase [Komagataeibacter nataicola]AQU88692.1 glycerol-3-phosphate dehydrogenase [Komagataeibacter nataicola]PYD66691.1 glycerol-3-phosphate dehydrogenase [Komagataeibacter nataicola]WEQ57058.1 glycerol-3-phosphate dehydrogenase/oxidase [Komagataeibacter nataicola]GBR26177.1 glycerol-3-phosphate dehydrogenase [Komagataeibacter nataicola NRIC 0616]
MNTAQSPVQDYDVIIIGAGINGVGLMRELAVQGARVLLVDRADICSGTSSAPSRLIHGGLKYLETGEFRLVAQSTLERNLLLRNAPHVVHPLPTTVPVRSWFGGIVPSVRRFLRLGGKMTDRGALVLELGLQIYDFLGRHARVMPRHRLFSGARTRARWPHMSRTVMACAQYYDAAISQPERLGYECVHDALRAQEGCRVATYTRVESFHDGIVALHDLSRGQSWQARAPVVVNAGGAWIDQVNAALGVSTRYIGGTKGAHLVLRHDGLLHELDGNMVYFGTPDGRICLAYPFLGHVLVGSTDIPVSDPDAAVCTDAEQSYMLDMLGALFPGFLFDASDVIYRYSGVRPLPASNASDPGAISRDHIVHEDRLGPVALFSLVGGKWTTFRGLAEEVADTILPRLGRVRQVSTRLLPIGGGRGYPRPTDLDAHIDRFAATSTIPRERARVLFDRYGTLAVEIARFCALGPDAPLNCLPSYTRREIMFIARNEQVRHVADILYRRTTIAMSGALTPDVTHEVAGITGETLGWDADKIQRQARDAWQEAETRHHLAARENAPRFMQPEPIGA